MGTKGKDSETIKDFIADLRQHGGIPEQITDAAIDISKACIKGVKEQLPNAVITFDEFQLIKMMNDAMGKIRAEETRQFPAFLKRSRYLFLKNPEYLTRRTGTIGYHGHQPVPQKRRSVHPQAESAKIYFAKSHQETEGLLQQWHRRTGRSTLGLIQKMNRP